jgi:hypothetical protein
LREKAIYAESCRVGHPATKTARAESTPFTRERYDSAVPTILAPDAKKAINRNATTQISLDLIMHEGR